MQKTNKALFLSLAALVAAVSFWQLPTLLMTKGAAESLPFLSQDKITEISVNKARLYAADDNWWVEEEGTKQPADKDKVNELINNLKLIKLDLIISENQENFDRLGFDRPTKMTVGSKIFEVGLVAGGGESTYIKVDNKVYEVKVILNKNLWTSNYWAREWVTNLPRYQIKKIVVQSGNTKKEYLAKDGVFENEKLADSAGSLKSLGWGGSEVDWEEKAAQKSEIRIETEGEAMEIVVGITRINQKLTYWAKEKNRKEYFMIDRKDALILTAN